MIQRCLRAWRSLPRTDRHALAIFIAIDVSLVGAAIVSWVYVHRLSAGIWLLGAIWNVWVTYTAAQKWLRQARAAHERLLRVQASERAAEIALKLGARLHAVAVERRIPIRYVADAEMGETAGTYNHSVVRDWWGRKRRVANEIRLNREWLDAPERSGSREWKFLTLAHELGHHIAINRKGDHSEEAADREAMRLVRSLLADDERGVIEPILVAVEQMQAGKEKIVRHP